MFSDNAVSLQSAEAPEISAFSASMACSTYQKVCAKDIVLEAKSD